MRARARARVLRKAEAAARSKEGVCLPVQEHCGFWEGSDPAATAKEFGELHKLSPKQTGKLAQALHTEAARRTSVRAVRSALPSACFLAGRVGSAAARMGVGWLTARSNCSSHTLCAGGRPCQSSRRNRAIRCRVTRPGGPRRGISQSGRTRCTMLRKHTVRRLPARHSRKPLHARPHVFAQALPTLPRRHAALPGR